MPSLHPDWTLLLCFAHTHGTVTVTLGLLFVPKVMYGPKPVGMGGGGGVWGGEQRGGGYGEVGFGEVGSGVVGMGWWWIWDDGYGEVAVGWWCGMVSSGVGAVGSWAVGSWDVRRWAVGWWL